MSSNTIGGSTGGQGLSPGKTLHEGRYRVRQKLGQGGMGAVYLADDTRLPGRQVALKENQNTAPGPQSQFKREALMLARLRHPNLPQVTDYFIEAGGQQYLVMDYVPGENLSQLMKQAKGPLPMEEALSAVEQVMQALHYMHTARDPESGAPRPVIHRDIKPANIKRTPEGRAVLVDFGIAKADGATATATALSARALTPGFAPIEQYNGGTDERSDVYALGATLFALLTGILPPSATNMATGTPLPPPRQLNRLVPERYSKVIERAMRLQPRDRYQSIAEFYQALFDRRLTTQPVLPAGSAQPVPQAAPTGSKRRGAVAASLAGGMLLVLAGAWFLLVEQRLQEVAPPGAVTEIAAATTGEQPGQPPGSQPAVPLADGPVADEGGATETPLMTPAEEATDAGTSLPTDTATPLPTDTATALPTGTPTATATETPPAPTSTLTPDADATAAEEKRAVAAAVEATRRFQQSVDATLTAGAPTSTSTPTATPTPSQTPNPSRTPSPTPRPSDTPAPTATNTVAPAQSNPGAGAADPALAGAMLTLARNSYVSNRYPAEAERLVNQLVNRLNQFNLPTYGISAGNMRSVFQRGDFGHRLNGLVDEIWGSWLQDVKANNFNAYSDDPGLDTISPFRKLVIRLIQGRAGSLIDNQQHGLWNYFTREEENSVWTSNMDGVIGAVNRSSFLWP
jgi:hypothetical protein